MALVVNDRVKETSTTTGTGTFTLAGAVTSFETFSSAIGNTNTTYYTIVNENGEFEVGRGTVAAGTLTRTTILSSSNSDSAVNFSSGTKDVFCTLPASKAVILDSSGNIVANNGSNLTALNATQLTSGTVPDARFPATLPAANGSALTALNATQLTSGTVPDARFPATLPALNGSALTALNATNLGSGTVPTARLGTGTASSTTFLAGDQTYKTITADITSVVAGSGLTGGGTTGDVTLNVGAGTGIDVAADAISVDVSDFMANGANNRIVTATGTDAQNAEANLTFDGTNLDLPDNTKIRVGTGNDLEIYHDGSNSFIAGGSGNQTVAIKPGGTGSVLITNSAGDNIITQQGDAAHLHYNNASILVTTAAGVVPGLNDTYDLGGAGNVWRNLYTGDLHLSNEAKTEGNAVDGTKGNWTIQEGSEDLYILNNKSGKKYKFKLEEI